jgi:hypothetical protein
LSGESFRLALERPQGEFNTRYQEVTIPKSVGKFVRAFRDMTAVLHDEKENDYPLEHELVVHETMLRASGYEID